jgi:hypothetical protein
MPGFFRVTVVTGTGSGGGTNGAAADAVVA